MMQRTTRTLTLLFSAWLVSLLLISAAKADEKAVLKIIEVLRDGSSFFQKDEYRKAALAWSNHAASMMSGNADRSAALGAAFSSVLASIAYERAEDALAYSEWGNAVQHYMSAGTNWAEQKALLYDYSISVKEQLNAAAAEDNGVYIDTDLQFFIALDGLVGFTLFEKPGSGLKAQDTSSDQLITENRNYFARPLSVVQQDDSGPSPMSRGHDVDTSLQEASDVESAEVVETPLADTAVAEAESAPSSKPVDTEKPSAQAADGSNAQSPITINADSLPQLLNTRMAQIKAAAEQPLADAGPQQKATVKPSAKPKSDQPLKKLTRGEQLREYQLSDADRARAQRAWTYFERNFNNQTGLVSSSESGGTTTGWDIGGQLAALVSAHQMGIVSDEQFDGLAQRSLAGLKALPLYGGKLPNRNYRTDTGEMLDLAGRVTSTGSGWSAVSTGRLMIWLRILAAWYPELRSQTIDIVSAWDFSGAISNSQLNSMTDDGKKSLLRQEGRLGYEQYAAAGFALWGLDVSRALTVPATRAVSVFDVSLAIDRRPVSYLTSDPFVLSEMELAGIHQQFSDIGDRLFEVQRQRWTVQKKLTAMGEDVLHGSGELVSNFVYNTDAGSAFNCLGKNGSAVPSCQTVSTKIAYGWNAIYDDPYSRALLSVVDKGVNTSRGFYSGIYEDLTINRVLTLDVNAIVLESLLLKFRQGAPFMRIAGSFVADKSANLISRGSWD